MSEIKQLKPEEFSEARKEAIVEKPLSKYKIVCTVCGKIMGFNTRQRIKLTEKHGENFRDFYKCRNCKK